MSKSFKEAMSFEERVTQSQYLIEKYPTKIPVILQRCNTDRRLTRIDQNKYLIPVDTTVAGLLQILRRRLDLNHNIAVYIFCSEKNILLSGSQIINDIYANYKDKDGFLYLDYCGENAFG